MKMMVYCPALNEEKNIGQTLQNIFRVLDDFEDASVLVVDDGSVDETAKIAASLGAQVLSHRTNLGVGRAFQTALGHALKEKVDILVSIDADGQFNPEDIPALIAPILDDSAVMVTGNRFNYGRPDYMSKIKYRGNMVVSRLIRSISNNNLSDVSCGFRAYSREALLHLNLFGEFTYTHETILDLANKHLPLAEVPVDIRYFPDRKSRVADSIISYALRSSKIIFRVMIDNKAIRVFGFVSSIFLLIGAAFEVFLIAHYLLRGSFTPYKAAGFIGLGFIIFGMFVLLFALIADLINRLRVNQEQILYRLKKQE
ncbi:MAG: glycosyltransferase family 2 protein [Anaerolineaceae bacterium]|nr:glycosyltransferase family 2 protein [Anaerolineaceae bacterium]